jgi:hypothetical protein
MVGHIRADVAAPGLQNATRLPNTGPETNTVSAEMVPGTDEFPFERMNGTVATASPVDRGRDRGSLLQSVVATVAVPVAPLRSAERRRRGQWRERG